MTGTTETTGGGDGPAVLSLSNSKGGVGKTSLAVHLAGGLSDRGLEVLVADLDPGGDLTMILGHADAYQPDPDAWSLHEALAAPEGYRSRLADRILQRDEFDLLPANERMLVQDTAEVLAGHDDGRLAVQRLFTTGAVDQYDVILLDNEPRINALTDAALVAADGVVVPLYAEALSAQGLHRLGQQIASVDHLGGGVEVLAFVLNRVEDNDQSAAVVRNVRENFGDDHAILEVRKRVDLQRSIARDDQSIFASSVWTDQQAVLADLAQLAAEGLGLDGEADE